MRRSTSLTPTVGHTEPPFDAIEGVDPTESIAGVGFAVRRVVVELFPKIRFGRAEMFFRGVVFAEVFLHSGF